MEGAKGTAAGNHMTASTNLLRGGRNDVVAGHLDGSTGREAGDENSSLRPYPKSTSACHVGRGLDVVVNGAWGRSSGICPKAETVSCRNPGEGGDQKVVRDLTASPDRTKARTNRLRTDDRAFRPCAGRKVDNGLNRGHEVYGPLGVRF